MSQPASDASRDIPGPVDLHLHSTRSDGRLDPAAVVDLAADAGLSAMALTDHDTLAGIEEAACRAAERGLELITGCEISTQHGNAERHLLAYGVDTEDAELLAALEANLQERTARVQRMVDALATVGLHITAADVLSRARGSVGRPHVADALVAAGHVKSRHEAFDRYLGDGKIGHVPRANLTTVRAISLVHGAGGVAVLAHPGRRWDATSLEELVSAGLDGLEVIHPSHGAQETGVLREAVQRFDLLATGGSDSHGDREGIEVMRARRVPATVLAALKVRLSDRRRARALVPGPIGGARA